MAEIDPKQLEPGTQIATKSGTKLSIIRFLGEGGQGSVYEVDYGGMRKALKWYKDLGRDPEAFRQNLEENVAKGSPSPGISVARRCYRMEGWNLWLCDGTSTRRVP